MSDPYNRHTATAKASTLHPGAFAKVAMDSVAAHRYQILLEHEGETFLVASGPSWLDALESWHDNHEEIQAKLGAAAAHDSGAKPGDGHSGALNSASGFTYAGSDPKVVDAPRPDYEAGPMVVSPRVFRELKRLDEEVALGFQEKED